MQSGPEEKVDASSQGNVLNITNTATILVRTDVTGKIEFALN